MEGGIKRVKERGGNRRKEKLEEGSKKEEKRW